MSEFMRSEHGHHGVFVLVGARMVSASILRRLPISEMPLRGALVRDARLGMSAQMKLASYLVVAPGCCKGLVVRKLYHIFRDN